jgi:phage terminase large subunit-like protein
VDVDPTTAYARAVIDGSVVAGRLVRQACRRHLEDVAGQTALGLEWRPAAAKEAIDFFAEVLCLPENTNAGDEADREDEATTPRPFILEPWQAFIVGALLRVVHGKGFRRFREAYIETAKGSGKTPLGAGIMLYLLVADGQRGAQCSLPR